MGTIARFIVTHEPDGYACNMGYVVRDSDGRPIYRGPQWAAEYRATTWNEGRTCSLV